MAKEIKKQNKNRIYFLISRYFKIITPILFVVILAAGYFAIIGQQLDKFNNSRQVDLSNAVSRNNQLKENKAYLQQMAKTEFLSDDDKKYIAMAVPDKFDFTSIASQLTSLAQAYNFAVISIQVDKLKTDEIKSSSGLMLVKVNMAIAGSDYNQFKLFLDGMEKSSMIFDVQSVSLVTNNSYQLEVLAYYFK